jgi:hypothetical protein
METHFRADIPSALTRGYVVSPMYLGSCAGTRTACGAVGIEAVQSPVVDLRGPDFVRREG